MKNKELPSKVLPLLFYFIKKDAFNSIGLLFFHIVWYIPSIILVPYLSKYLIDNIVTINFWFGVIIISLYAITESLPYITNIFLVRFRYLFSAKTTEKLRCYMFSYMIRQNNNYFNNNFSGSIAKKVSNITDNFVAFISSLFDFMAVCLTLLIALIMLIVVNYKILLIIVVWLPLYIIGSYYLLKNLNKKTIIVEESDSEFYGLINDDFVNIINIKNFSQEEHEFNKLNQSGKKVLKNRWKEIVARNYVSSFNYINLVFFSVSTLIMCVLSYFSGNITVGTFVSLMILVKVVVSFQAQLVIGLEQLTEMYGTINNGLSLLEHSNEIEDCATAKNIQNISGRIEFKNVNFTYNNNLN